MRVLRDKNDEMNRMLGFMGTLESGVLMETTKLNEMTNQMGRERKRLKK